MLQVIQRLKSVKFKIDQEIHSGWFA